MFEPLGYTCDIFQLCSPTSCVATILPSHRQETPGCRDPDSADFDPMQLSVSFSCPGVSRARRVALHANLRITLRPSGPNFKSRIESLPAFSVGLLVFPAQKVKPLRTGDLTTSPQTNTQAPRGEKPGKINQRRTSKAWLAQLSRSPPPRSPSLFLRSISLSVFFSLFIPPPPLRPSMAEELGIFSTWPRHKVQTKQASDEDREKDERSQESPNVPQRHVQPASKETKQGVHERRTGVGGKAWKTRRLGLFCGAGNRQNRVPR